MTIVHGHYDGKQVVLDEPVPPDIRPDTPVKVVFEKETAESVLDRIAKLAGPSDLPPDYSERHGQYTRCATRARSQP